MMVLVLLLSLTTAVSSVHYTTCEKGPCGAGEYFSKDQACQPCKPGSYMPHTNHACQSCYVCTERKDWDFVAVANCTRFEDTKYRCSKGDYYLKLPDDPHAMYCKPCTKCASGEEEDKPCDDFNDRKCTMKPSCILASVVVINRMNLPRNVTTIVPPEPDQTTLTSSPKADNNTTQVIGHQEPAEDQDNTLVIVSVSVSVVVIILAIIVVFLCRRRLLTRCRYHEAPKTDIFAL